ncbi:MAG: hypothetical protein DRQ55_11280 [Planctomycetota bacterium]|nr:MAG: hypothetical protein DRQ55_11280 [Planctomycetota bacterium]
MKILQHAIAGLAIALVSPLAAAQSTFEVVGSVWSNSFASGELSGVPVGAPSLLHLELVTPGVTGGPGGSWQFGIDYSSSYLMLDGQMVSLFADTEPNLWMYDGEVSSGVQDDTLSLSPLGTSVLGDVVMNLRASGSGLWDSFDLDLIGGTYPVSAFDSGFWQVFSYDDPFEIQMAVDSVSFTPTPPVPEQGSIFAWGSDYLGNVTGTPHVGAYTQVAAGRAHSVALRVDGSIAVWGGDSAFPGVIDDAPSGTGFTQVAAGQDRCHALRADGSIVSWGWSDFGTVGDTPLGSGYLQVVAGQVFHSAALRADGSIVAWGLDHYGVISNTPPGTGFLQISAGSHHFVALRADGTIVSWGSDGQNQVADTPAGWDFLQVSAVGNRSAALRYDGSIVEWGEGVDPALTPLEYGCRQVSAGGLALRADGSIVAWGNDSNGQVSTAPEGTGFTQIAVGEWHSLALLGDNPVWSDMGGALAGNSDMHLVGLGQLVGGTPANSILSGATPYSVATLVIGLSYLGAPFKGGIWGPSVGILVEGVPTGPYGQIQVPGTWPVGVLSGIEFYEQWWMVDPGALHGRASSNTIRATTP